MGVPRNEPLLTGLRCQYNGGRKWPVAADNAKREDVESWIADGLRQCADHGAKCGVIVAVQNHGDFLSRIKGEHTEEGKN